MVAVAHDFPLPVAGRETFLEEKRVIAPHLTVRIRPQVQRAQMSAKPKVFFVPPTSGTTTAKAVAKSGRSCSKNELGYRVPRIGKTEKVAPANSVTVGERDTKSGDFQNRKVAAKHALS